MGRFGARSAVLLIALIALVTGAYAGRAEGAEGERPRIAVDPVAGENVAPELRERVQQSVTEGLLAAGADVASENPAFVLRGKVEVEGRSYAIRLEMVDVKTGQVVASREDRCEICTESEAFETASTAASALKAQVIRRSAGPLRTAGPAPAPPLAPAATVAALPSAEVAAPSAPPAARPNRALGWGAIAVGALAAGAGGYLIGIDGSYVPCDNPTDLPCPEQRNTGWLGIGLVSAGVVAFGLGVLALLGKI